MGSVHEFIIFVALNRDILRGCLHFPCGARFALHAAAWKGGELDDNNRPAGVKSDNDPIQGRERANL
jgi:hypothetical protein